MYAIILICRKTTLLAHLSASRFLKSSWSSSTRHWRRIKSQKTSIAHVIHDNLTWNICHSNKHESSNDYTYTHVSFMYSNNWSTVPVNGGRWCRPIMTFFSRRSFHRVIIHLFTTSSHNIRVVTPTTKRKVRRYLL